MIYRVSESVGVGHPDKLSDLIADSLLMEALKLDIDAKFSCEVLTSKGLIVVAGEVSIDSEKKPNYPGIISSIISNLGYDLKEFQVLINIKEQSADIKTTSLSKEGKMLSGDQSIVIGYATNETPKFMPMSFVLSHEIMRSIFEKTKNKELKGVKFDAKCMVVLSDVHKVDKVLISIHHEESADLNRLFDDLFNLVVEPIMNKYSVSMFRDELYVNNSGPFCLGGLDADTGLVNRKIVLDSYGSSVRNGGGGYSGKDLSKVDRLGAYYARWICKNYVASGLCTFMEMELIYFCGSSEPIFNILSGDFHISYESVVESIRKIFPTKFDDIYKLFNRSGIEYDKLACFGHFGSEDLNLPWEELDKVEDIKNYFY